MQVDLGQLFSVALLALLGALIARRFHFPRRLLPLLPLLLAICILWIFGEKTAPETVLAQGMASGLMAGGFVYLWVCLFGQTR